MVIHMISTNVGCRSHYSMYSQKTTHTPPSQVSYGMYVLCILVINDSVRRFNCKGHNKTCFIPQSHRYILSNLGECLLWQSLPWIRLLLDYFTCVWSSHPFFHYYKIMLPVCWHPCSMAIMSAEVMVILCWCVLHMRDEEWHPIWFPLRISLCLFVTDEDLFVTQAGFLRAWQIHCLMFHSIFYIICFENVSHGSESFYMLTTDAAPNLIVRSKKRWDYCNTNVQRDGTLFGILSQFSLICTIYATIMSYCKKYAYSVLFMVMFWEACCHPINPYPWWFLHCHPGKHIIDPVPLKQPWKLWVNKPHKNTKTFGPFY